jgi:hypothetical protein
MGGKLMLQSWVWRHGAAWLVNAQFFPDSFRVARTRRKRSRFIPTNFAKILAY